MFLALLYRLRGNDKKKRERGFVTFVDEVSWNMILEEKREESSVREAKRPMDNRNDGKRQQACKPQKKEPAFLFPFHFYC